MIRNLLVFVTFSIISINIFAQSGRTIPPTPTPEILNYESEENPNCGELLSEYVYIPPKKIVEFTEELNRNGACGYRLQKSNKIFLTSVEVSEANTAFFAVMELDPPNKYQYQWFEAYNFAEAQTRMNIRAEQGFYFRASHPFHKWAANEQDNLTDLITQEWRSSFGTFIIFEKKNNELIKKEYRVLDAEGVGKKRKEEIQRKLNITVGLGFYPVGFTKQLSSFGIIMEKENERSNYGKVEILSYNFSFTKKLNEFSKRGYSPLLLVDNVALLEEKSKSISIPTKYYLFEKPEKILKNPAQLVGKIFIRSGLFFGGEDLRTNLLFAENEVNNDKYEYKFHKMTDVANREKGVGKYNALREPPTKEMLSGFNSLLEQGYIIREILSSDEIYILFERSLNKTNF